MGQQMDDPIIKSFERTGLPPHGSEEAPVCPECGEPCDTLYFNAFGDVIGCDNCITARDAWDLFYEQ